MQKGETGVMDGLGKRNPKNENGEEAFMNICLRFEQRNDTIDCKRKGRLKKKQKKEFILHHHITLACIWHWEPGGCREQKANPVDV